MSVVLYDRRDTLHHTSARGEGEVTLTGFRPGPANAWSTHHHRPKGEKSHRSWHNIASQGLNCRRHQSVQEGVLFDQVMTLRMQTVQGGKTVYIPRTATNVRVWRGGWGWG